MIFIFLFLLNLYICLDPMWRAMGIDFADTFTDSERFLWNKEHGYLHCVGDIEQTGQCRWLTEDNLQYYTRPPTGRSIEHTGLLLFVRNNCEGRHCCRRDFCTRYTTGSITSILSYSYGSFRFISKPLSKTNMKDDVWPCFTLESSRLARFEKGMETIALCARLKDPLHATALWHSKDGKMLTYAMPLGFDIRKKKASYRIDWTPSHVVRWWSNAAFDFDLWY